MRETTRVPSSEWPPSAKKSSCTPTRSVPSTAAQIPTRISSAGVEGGTGSPSPAASAAGSGRARRSVLPLGVSGMASSATNADGTM